MAISTRETDGTGVINRDRPLTNTEVDTNFIEIVADIADKVNTADLNESIDDRVNALLQAGLGIDLDYDDVSGELTIDSNHVEVTCTNNFGASIAIGTPVYQTGVSGNNITIAPADADDAAKMPAIGMTTSTIANGADGTVVILGVVKGLDTSSFTAGDTVYVSTIAGALTTTAPAGESSLIQNFGRVLKVNASSGSIAVMGAGRANAVPNLNDGNVFIGNASNQAEARALTGDDISGGTITSFASTGIDDNATSTAITIDASENVGIGTTDPNGLLSLGGVNPNLAFESTGGNAFVDVRTVGDTLSFRTSNASTNDTTAMTIDSGGRVGIGGSPTNSLLELIGNNSGQTPLTAINALRFKSTDPTDVLGQTHGSILWETSDTTDSGVNAYISTTGFNNGLANLVFGTGTPTSLTERMIISGSSGNVGIGTNNPFNPLSVSANGNSGFEVLLDNPTYGPVSLLSYDRTASVYEDMSYRASNHRWYNEGSTERLRIDSGGRVLINNTNTVGSLNLEVSAPSGFSVVSGFYSPSTQATIDFKDSNTTDNYKVRIGSEADDLLLFAGGSERLRITDSGNVDIGTATAFGGHLEIYKNSSTGSDYGLSVRQDGTDPIARFAGNGDVERVRIGSNGNVGIGTGASVSAPLHVGRAASGTYSIFDDGVNGRFTFASVTGATNENRIFSTTTGFGAYEDINIVADNLLFSTGSPTGVKMKIDSSGDVIATGDIFVQGGQLNLTDAQSPALPASIVNTGTYGNNGGYTPLKSSGQLQYSAASHLFADNSVVLSGYPVAWSKIDSGFTWGNYSNTLMTLTSSGRLGIGTSNPQNTFVVSDGNDGLEFRTTLTNDNRIVSYNRGTSAFTRMSLSAADFTFLLGAAGTQAVTIDSSSKVGINTDSPASYAGGSTLAVNESGGARISWNNTSRPWYIAGDSGSDDMRIGLRGSSDTVDVDVITATVSGNVGIGTDNPTEVLSIEAQTNPRIKFTDTGNWVSSIGVEGSTGAFTFENVDGTERMRINASGNVGIGEDNPTQALVVSRSSGSTYVDISRDTQGQGQVALQLNGGTGGTNWIMYQDASSNDLRFFGNAANRMTIDSSGNVGIGTDNPSGKLDVELGTTGIIAEFRGADNDILQVNSEDNLIALDVRNTSSGLDFQIQGSSKVRIDSSGNLLVGTTTPLYTAKHTVYNSGGNIGILGVCQSGTATSIPVMRCYHASASGGTSARMLEFLAGNTAIVGRITANGTTTDYVTSSDARLKENIQDADSSGSIIDALQVRQFDWKVDGSHDDYGFVAQELEQVYPKAVSKGETEDDTWGVDYSKLVPLLVKEIQELKAEVAALKGA